MADDHENKTERVQLLMAPTEVELIDDWGFKNRIRTRAEAIRRLCQLGLSADDTLTKAEQITTAGETLLRQALSEWRQDNNDLDPLSKEAPSHIQDAAIAAGAIQIGLTFIARATYDLETLSNTADLKLAIAKVLEEMPAQQAADTVGSEFIAKLKALRS